MLSAALKTYLPTLGHPQDVALAGSRTDGSCVADYDDDLIVVVPVHRHRIARREIDLQHLNNIVFQHEMVMRLLVHCYDGGRYDGGRYD